MVVIKSERIGNQSAEPNHADIKHPRGSASGEILLHALSFVCVCECVRVLLGVGENSQSN